MAARGNGTKIVGGLIGLVLLLVGALVTSFSMAANHISRLDAQSMVDREIGHVNESIGLLRDDIAALHELVQQASGHRGGG